MKVLIVPMSAIAETAGPASRCKLLAEAFLNNGIETATCMAADINFKKIDNVPNYFLDIPMPFGLPKVIASRMFPLAQKFGLTARKTVRSFDQVLLMTGNLDYKYLKRSVVSVRNAVKDFKPDVIYSEFNLSAMIAARIENIPLWTTVSYPTQPTYAHNPRLAAGLNKLLREYHIPQVESALHLFDWADKKICPSIKELEPFNDDVTFCGALKSVNPTNTTRNKILVYMGNGTISADKTKNVITEAFTDSKYEVFIASKYLGETTYDNIHIAARWDFNQLLDEAVLYINHGGQNSIIDGLIHGVPQIVVPGKVFERKYNAESLVRNDAGLYLAHRDFTAKNISTAAEQIIGSKDMAENVRALGEKLRNAGGINTLIKSINR